MSNDYGKGGGAKAAAAVAAEEDHEAKLKREKAAKDAKDAKEAPVPEYYGLKKDTTTYPGTQRSGPAREGGGGAQDYAGGVSAAQQAAAHAMRDKAGKDVKADKDAYTYDIERTYPDGSKEARVVTKDEWSGGKLQNDGWRRVHAGDPPVLPTTMPVPPEPPEAT